MKLRLQGGKESPVCPSCKMRRDSGEFLAFPNPTGTQLSEAHFSSPQLSCVKVFVPHVKWPTHWHAVFRSSFFQPPTIVCQGFCHVQDRMLLGNRMMNSLFKNRRGEGVLSLFFTQRLTPQKSLSVFRLPATHWHVQDRMLPGNRMMNSLFKSRRGEGVLSLFFTQRLIPQTSLSVFRLQATHWHVQDRMLPGNRMMDSLFNSRRGEGVLSLFFTQRLIPRKSLSVFRLPATHWHVQDRMLLGNRMMNSLFKGRGGEESPSKAARQ